MYICECIEVYVFISIYVYVYIYIYIYICVCVCVCVVFMYYVCTTLYANNINSQLDATVIIVLIISISSTCFGPAGDQDEVELCSTSSWSPAGSIVGALYHRLLTQSSATEDGRNYRPKHVELIEIINKIIIVASSWLFILLYQ